MRYKTIHDTVHGSVKFEEPFLDLLECPEIQRLHNIMQLGLTKLVFPGANHTRFEHSIGAYRVAQKMAENLDLKEDEKHLVMSAALLHDLGHAPFSHTLETILEHATGMDHMDLTKEFITGKRAIEERNTPLVPEILEDHGISPKKVAELVKGREHVITMDEFGVHDNQKFFGEDRYLYQIIHGPLDVDQLDYLLRDSHYTGALHGVIDLERLLQTVEIHNGDLVVTKGGVPAVEGMLVARGLMFSSVYLHKTARIAELMLSKAVYALEEDIKDIFLMTDWELLSHLYQKGGFPADMVERLKYRRLYKRFYSLEPDRIEEAKGVDLERMGVLDEIKKLEKDIAFQGHVSSEEVIVDVPHRELKLSEPRLTKTGVKILDKGRLYELSRFSPIARALQKRLTQRWAIMVSSPEEHCDVLKPIVKRIIEG